MKRKTFKKKATAKKARKKGQAVYKVKGGYRISKRRKRCGFVQVWMLWLMIAAGVALVFGCSEADKRKADAAAVKAAEVSEAVQTAVESDAGAVIPEPWRTQAGLLAGLVASLAASWQTYRKKQLRDALGDVVIANERFKEGEAANVPEFKRVQDAIQAPATRKIVKQIRSQGY